MEPVGTRRNLLERINCNLLEPVGKVTWSRYWNLLEPVGTYQLETVGTCWKGYMVLLLEPLRSTEVFVATSRDVGCLELLKKSSHRVFDGSSHRERTRARSRSREQESKRAREQESKRAREQDNEREREREREGEKKKRSVYSSLRRFFFVLSSLSKKRGERKLEREREHRDARERTREIEGERARERARDGKIEEERATERAREISRIGEMIERRRSGERES